MSDRPGLLAGKRCLLVGGTGGLGQAAARRFLQEGAAVVLAGHEPEAGRAAAESLSGLGPCSFLPADATQSDEVERLFAQAVAGLGGLDVLYHLAGASGRRHGDGALHECSDAGWQATLAVNLTSVLALSPAPVHFDTCAYAAAKGAILSMSRQAASRYAAAGIRVNVLAPGLIDTPMSRRAVGDPAIARYLAAKQPLRGGPGRPDDCADAAVFLCSDAAGFITGVVLPVDGGWCVSEGQ
jgi:NAD(P)-dependent dehydrogenase (short-subunit alcohol dehydrogenase family)